MATLADWQNGHSTRPARALLVIIRARSEPRLERLAAVAALKIEDDHMITASGIGRRWLSAGYARAHVGDALEVDVGKADARLLAHVEQHLAPRIDDQRMAEGLAAVLVTPDLRRRDDEQPRLDRPRAQQHVPMRLARSGR